MLLVYASKKLLDNVYNSGMEDTKLSVNKTFRPPKRKRTTCCKFGECTKKLKQSTFDLGFCKWCQRTYCNEHRLPEAHVCEGLTKCRKTSFDENAVKLGGNGCKAVKVAMIA